MNNLIIRLGYIDRLGLGLLFLLIFGMEKGSLFSIGMFNFILKDIKVYNHYSLFLLDKMYMYCDRITIVCLLLCSLFIIVRFLYLITFMIEGCLLFCSFIRNRHGCTTVPSSSVFWLSTGTDQRMERERNVSISV